MVIRGTSSADQCRLLSQKGMGQRPSVGLRTWSDNPLEAGQTVASSCALAIENAGGACAAVRTRRAVFSPTVVVATDHVAGAVRSIDTGPQAIAGEASLTRRAHAAAAAGPAGEHRRAGQTAAAIAVEGAVEADVSAIDADASLAGEASGAAPR